MMSLKNKINVITIINEYKKTNKMKGILKSLNTIFYGVIQPRLKIIWGLIRAKT